VAALLSRYTTPGQEGSVYGLDNAIVSASRTLAPLLGAAVVVLMQALGLRVFEYRVVFILTGGFFVLSALIALPAPARAYDARSSSAAARVAAGTAPLGIVAEVRREPAFGLAQAHPLAGGVILQLVSMQLPTPK
jgi:hypothetical protein